MPNVYRAALAVVLFLFLSVAGAQEALTLEGVAFTSDVADVNGVTLHYVTGGEGEPVVLLHGWPQTWREWEPVMPALAERYRVVAVDLRGAGASSIPEGGYDKRTLAADIYDLLQTLGVDRAHIVGHDIGGMVGYAFASVYPQATRTFTILDVPLPGVEPVWQQVLLNPMSWHFGFHQQEGLAETLVRGRERFYLSTFMEEIAADPEALAEAVEVSVAAYSRPGRMRAGFAYYRAFPQDAEDNAGFAETPLEMPVLALGGDMSAAAFIVPMMEAVANDVAGGAISDAGHWLTEEQPEVLSARLLEFFAANRR